MSARWRMSFTSKQNPWYHNLPLRANSTLWHHYSGLSGKKGAFWQVTLPFWAPVPPMRSSPWPQLLCSHCSCRDCQSWRAPASPFLPAPPADKWRQNKGLSRTNAWRQGGQSGEGNGDYKKTIRKNSSCFAFIEKALLSRYLGPQHHTGK